MTNLNYLCQPVLTKSDLLRVEEEHQALRLVIEEFKLGKRTKDEFLAAKQQLKDLIFLTFKASERLQRMRLRIP
jgi:hypothetical protein